MRGTVCVVNIFQFWLKHLISQNTSEVISAKARTTGELMSAGYQKTLNTQRAKYWGRFFQVHYRDKSRRSFLSVLMSLTSYRRVFQIFCSWTEEDCGSYYIFSNEDKEVQSQLEVHWYLCKNVCTVKCMYVLTENIFRWMQVFLTLILPLSNQRRRKHCQFFKVFQIKSSHTQ